jgi:hypothetical protein
MQKELQQLLVPISRKFPDPFFLFNRSLIEKSFLQSHLLRKEADA